MNSQEQLNAVINNDLKFINNLINMNFQIEQNCLNRASELGLDDMVALLLTTNLEPEKNNNIAILYAYYNEHYNVCALLLNNKNVKENLKENHEDIYIKILRFIKINSF